jgi:hypothetical protein
LKLIGAVGVGAFILVLVPVLLVWVPIYLLALGLWGVVLRAWFWNRHGRRGRRVLFVYSNSPNWQSYIEEHFLPRLGEHAVVINWSERSQWGAKNPWEGFFFHRFAGSQHFNPMAFVLRPRLRFHEVRFHQAFLDLKHGKPAALHAAESEFWGLVERAA